MPGVLTSIPYPGRHVKRGEHDPEVVLALQRRLNAMGCGPLAETGRFGADTLNAVRRFQARFPDIDGQPLKVDGVAGPLTWAALFGAPSTPVPGPVPSLATSALALARSQVGVRESPAGSNRGPEVDIYLRAVGLNPAAGSYAWCAAFVYWCFNEAARSAGRPNPLPRTAGVLAHWNRAGDRGVRRIAPGRAAAQPDLVQPGQVFVMDYGAGVGHTGFVAEVHAGKLVTIEGNTNDGGSREGIGVFERHGRKINSINRGFLDYAGS